MNTTVQSPATADNDQAMPGAMDRVFDLPTELVNHFFEGFVIPDMHIMVRRKRTFTNWADQYYVELLNPEEWRDFLHLAATNTDMRIRCKQAFKDAQKVKSISVVMDMSRHAIDPRRRVPNSLLGTEAPMWLLRMMKRLTVLCPYVIQSTPTMDGKDTEIVTKQIRSTYQLYPPFTAGAPQPGQNDTILSVDWLTLHYEAAPDSGFAFATAASDNIEYALRHARVAQRSIPTPYLPVVTPKGLYDLGLLFTEFAGTCAVAKEALEQDRVRFRIGDHEMNVEWQRWVEAVEEEEMERSDSEDEEDGEEESGDQDDEGKKPAGDTVDGKETSREGDDLTGEENIEKHQSGEEGPSEDGGEAGANVVQQVEMAGEDTEMPDSAFDAAEQSSAGQTADIDSEAYTSSDDESDVD
ncbi:uncharacterized protein MYCGRDRAFT_94810 [Zymoseptoria tritici IPO323]|uniref:Uncharacterized protein n=1 Tax=Zymoseptoria tritici (strain CBS 115943 / IPO323) TaxID=336722 RepID=F9XF83_ZYMTI|nr:uncharacterized protein MYCGRDRAFT_94810 [Zymoseptoria tritici IPO323]EGP85884.1 hypothetical protein MYCGRDRAFT_94810 [Zymoseptoria tritici IPO323]